MKNSLIDGGHGGLKESINDIQAKLHRLQNQSVTASCLMNTTNQQMNRSNGSNNVSRTGVVRNSFHGIRSNSHTKHSFNLGRPRTTSNIVFDTPGCPFDQSRSIQMSSVVLRDPMRSSQEKRDKKPGDYSHHYK